MSGLADLHRHLDGSLRPETLAELAAAQGRAVPADLAFSEGMGLEAALSRFAFTLSLLQEADTVKRVAAEICEDAEAEGVSTLELRFAPQLHTGAAPEEIVDAALEGIDGRAGLILCALYGEDPAVAEHLVELGASRPGVVGLDLAGGPAPGHRFALMDYLPAFTAARNAGLGRTVHAGEGRPPGEIWQAVALLGAQRIGHGTTLLESEDVLRMVVECGTLIEACPTSNWHTGVIPEVAAHPIAQWLERGVRVCVNTDNTLLSAVDAPEEHRRVAAIPGMTEALLEQAVEHGHAGAFSR